MKKTTLLFLFCLTSTVFTYGQYLTEGFEGGASIPTGWTLSQTNANETWYIGTTQAQANTGSNYAIVEYDAALGNQNESLTTPMIDLTSATNPRLVFWWNASYFWSVDPNDNYDFTVSVDDGTNVTQVFTETDEADFDSTDDNFVWFQRTIDLSAYIGQNDIRIVFNYSGADGASLTIDDILVEETPTCPVPTGITANVTSSTETTISWTAGGSETNWTYEYGVTGFTQGAGTSSTTTMTSVDLTMLTPGETYDVYVQANCGMGDNSVWTAVVSFTTPPLPPANDDCDNAIPVTVNTDGMCTTVTAGTTVGATASSQADDVTGTPNTDVWFSFVASNATQTIELLNIVNQGGGTSPSVDMGMGVYDAAGGCGGLTLVGDSDPNTLELTGLTQGDTYYLRVYGWFSSIQYNNFDVCIRGPLPPIVPNYSETFDSYPPVGWSEADGAFESPNGTSSGFTGDDFINDTGHANGKCAKINIYGTDTDEYMISPRFDLSGGTYYLNFEIGLTVWNATTAATLGVDDYVAFIVTQDGGTTWTELLRWDSSTPISETGQSITEIVLSGYGPEVQFAYYAFSDTSNEDNDFFIDNFQITTATLSTPNDKIEGFSLFPTLVEDRLNFDALEDVHKISVYNILGQEVYTASPNISKSYVDLSGLKGGIYIVRVQVGNAAGTYKIIKE